MNRWFTVSSAALALLCTLAMALPALGEQEIDRILKRENQDQGVKLSPAPVVDDLAYLRRVSVDLIGRIPSYGEIQEYMSWPQAERRSMVVDKLLKHERFADRWTAFFADTLRLRSQTLGGNTLIARVHQAIDSETPYDELCRELITAYGKPNEVPGVAFILGDDADPLAMAAVTSQVFMGIRMGCAECHDHPFDVWTRKDFYELAAFFGKTRRMETNIFMNTRFVYTTEVDQTAILWPPEGVAEPQERKPLAPRFPIDMTAGTNRSTEQVLARLRQVQESRRRAEQAARDAQQTVETEVEDLLAEAGRAKSDGSAVNVEIEAQQEIKRIDPLSGRYRPSELRAELARLVTSPENRYFSRTIVNRLWAELVGRGFVEPIDDFREDNLPSHPDTLDYLADEFVASGFHFKTLLRLIVTSDAYSRAHITGVDEETRLEYESSFLATPMRRMISEALYDSIITAGHLFDVKHPPGANIRVYYTTQRVPKKAEGKPGEEPAEVASIVPAAPAGQPAMEAGMMAGGAPMPAMAGYDLEQAIELDFGKVLADAGAPELEQLAVVSQEELEAQMMAQRAAANQTRRPGVEYEEVTIKNEVDENPRYSSSLRMASPAPEGHFLRVFGQPARAELGDLRDDSPSMRQALMILNGKVTNEAARVGPLEPIHALLVGANADLAKATRLAYREILTREPTAGEIAEAREIIDSASNPLEGMADLRWVLLNCHEFRFLQ